MHTQISTRHGHLSSETQEKISNKIAKLSRFHEKLSGTTVTIDLKDEHHPDVELCALVDGTPGFVARTNGSNLMGAVEGAIQKIEQQLKKHKKKLIDHVRDSARRNQQVESTHDEEQTNEE